MSIKRRSNDDAEWARVREFVLRRDGRACRLLKCLSPLEAKLYVGDNERGVDPAHVFSAASRPDLLYNAENVVCLRRTVHRRMDEYRSPIDGSHISLEMHWYWWYRILCGRVLPIDELNYESLCLLRITGLDARQL